MKMAKASDADLAAAAKICHALESISGIWCASMPAELCDDPDQPDEFDIDNGQQCRRVLELLTDLAHCSRLARVVFGMMALLDPTNRLVHPDSDHLETHPDIDADRADAARFRWLTEDHSDPAVRQKCRELIDRLPVMSRHAACQDIDAAMSSTPSEESA